LGVIISVVFGVIGHILLPFAFAGGVIII
jgi:hypothetical protein